MIKIEHLKKQYPNVTPLKDVSVEIRNGDVISVIGPSGTGKSTLLRCINQLEKPTSGKIWLDDVEIDSKQAMEMAATYSTITAGTMDAFASVINNNMNEVMRKLTVITLTLQLAAIITGFMGMNIRLPFGRSESWLGVTVISGLCLLSTVGSYLYFQYRPEKIDGKISDNN